MSFAEPFRTITIDEYRDEFEQTEQDYVLLDVREVDEFHFARMPGAINIPLSVFQDRFQEVPADRPIVLVCARGGRSAMAAEWMAYNGYDELYNLIDGVVGWQERGLPTERGD